MAPNDTSAGAPARQGFLAAALQTFGAQLAVAVLSLGNALVVARALGPEGRGEVAFLTAIAFLVSTLSTWGVQEANVNLAGTEPALRRALATNSVILSLVFGLGGVVAVAGLIAAVPAVGGEADGILLAVTLGSVPPLVLNTYLRFLIQGDYGFTVTNAAWTLPAVLNVAVNGSLALASVLSVAAALATWIGGQLIATAMLAWWVARRSAGFGRPSLPLARRTLAFGVRSHAGRIMLVANYRLDQWILGALSGPRELGLYSVAVAWAEALFLLPTALSYVQRPDLVRATRQEAARRAARVFRSALLLTAPAAAGLVVAAPLLCVIAFGEEFRGAVDDLRVLALGAFGIVALKQLGNALTARQRPTLASAAVASAFVSTVVLDFALIPSLGGLGAALASSVSYTLGGVVVAIIFLRALDGRRRDLVPTRQDVAELLAVLRRERGPAPALPGEPPPAAPESRRPG